MHLDIALPPGFATVGASNPIRTAVARAELGADPGTVFYLDAGGRCILAVILTPETPVEDASLRFLVAQALHDALASLAPVGLPIAIEAGQILVNDGVVATFGVRRAPTATGGVPDWLVLWVDVAIDLELSDPGLDPLHTCLAEEGFAASAAKLMAAFCRQLLAGIDALADGAARREAA